jgi:ABC-type multidrug transport system fused ATPase/permease subunit
MNLSYKNNFWGYFNFYYKIVGNRLFLYLFLSVMISLMDGIGLAMFIPLLQTVGGQKASAESMGSMSNLTTDLIEGLGFELNIVTVLCVMMLLFVTKGLFKYIQLTYYASVRQFFIKTIRYKLVNNLQNLSYSAFLKLDSGRIQNTLTQEVARLFNTMTLYFNSVQSFSMLTTYVVLAIMANYQFALLIGVGSVISNLLYRRIYVATQKASMEIAEKGSDFNSFLVQAVHYFKYLKSTNTFAIYSKKLKGVIDETEALNKKMGQMRAIGASIKEPIIVLIVCFVIIIQVSWMGAGLNSIILSLLLFYRALTYLVSVQNDWHGFIENSGGLSSVATLSGEMTAAREEIGQTPFNKLSKEIILKDVEFYFGPTKAIDEVNITIPSRKTIALIGESGSGKTTLANLIAGLHTPASGYISVDGVQMKDLDLNAYRSKIGYISQESVIFNDSIYDNVTFWSEKTPENLKRFYEILEMASLKDFVLSLPEKENTILGDNGILISGGQRQRISIAREMFKSSEVLILDEATSALDSETEKIIQENIEKLHGTYTMIVIAHRLSTIKEADIIFLVENGKITASGNFDEMFNKSSRFKKMVSLQAV